MLINIFVFLSNNNSIPLFLNKVLNLYFFFYINRFLDLEFKFIY